jgi:hypothetical protein
MSDEPDIKELFRAAMADAERARARDEANAIPDFPASVAADFAEAERLVERTRRPVRVDVHSGHVSYAMVFPKGAYPASMIERPAQP